MEKRTVSSQEMLSFSHENFAAFMKSGQIWTTGFQEISKVFTTAAQAPLDRTLATSKGMRSAASLKEATDPRTSLVYFSFEKALAETSKLTKAPIALAEESMEPVKVRMARASEKFHAVAAQ